jgi:hypothetical protein
MKKTIILILVVISVLGVADNYAQMQAKTKFDSCYAGVYRTYDDFLHVRLSNKVNTEAKGNSFGFLFIGKTIKIVTPDTTIKFNIGSIYGFYECQSIYRYSPNVELYSPEDYYKIEENGGENLLTIYTSVFYGGAEHFFSTGLNMPIHRLSMSHLEMDFGELFPDFIKAVKKMKKENEGAIAAKDKTGIFLINKLYQQYVTK